MRRGCCSLCTVPATIALGLCGSIGSGKVSEDTFAVRLLVSAQEAHPVRSRAFQSLFEMMKVFDPFPGKAAGALWLPTPAAWHEHRLLRVHSVACCDQSESLAEISP